MDPTTVPVLLDGARTPFGRLGGRLAGLTSRELATTVVERLVERTPELARCDAALIGQVLQAAQGQNPARLAATSGGIDLSVPGITLNSVCLAGLSAVADAARRVRLGEGSLYLVGGADSMSRAPHASLIRQGTRPGPVELVDTMVRDGLWCSLTDEGMGELSERANVELGIKRAEQDEIALASHRRAAEATDSGRLAEELVALDLPDGSEMAADEGIRRDTTLDKLERLPAAFTPDGSITAGNASQMSDGASVGVVASLATAESLGRVPLARIVAWADVAGPDNTLHLKPAAAVRAVLDRAGLPVTDVDLFEINEAFAAVVAASCGDLGLPLDVVNVNGGAISLGHPLGGTGFRLLLTLALEMRRREARYGIATLCGGGGQGMAVLIERTS